MGISSLSYRVGSFNSLQVESKVLLSFVTPCFASRFNSLQVESKALRNFLTHLSDQSFNSLQVESKGRYMRSYGIYQALCFNSLQVESKVRRVIQQLDVIVPFQFLIGRVKSSLPSLTLPHTSSVSIPYRQSQKYYGIIAITCGTISVSIPYRQSQKPQECRV